MITFLNFIRNPVVTAIVPALAVFLWAVAWHGPGKYREGAAAEKAAAVERAAKLNQKREEDTNELTQFGISNICRELGGLRDDCPD